MSSFASRRLWTAHISPHGTGQSLHDRGDARVQPVSVGSDARSEPCAVVDRRPWGRFDVLALNAHASVKILTVGPGGRLSLQRHRCRDEWWHIIDGGLVVEVGGPERPVTVDERVWIPRGTVHRIRNVSDQPARFLEIAFGEFDESDIERLSDDYGRAQDRNWEEPQATELTVVVPTFNERDNVAPLVAGLEHALTGVDAQVLFVDDSTDDTAEVIRQVARTSTIPVGLLHREQRTGGLSGAVCAGLREATGTYVVVMDGDLQHPPDVVPRLLLTAGAEHADVVVASRYCRDGDASGLGSSWRRSASSLSTLLARLCFPRRIGSVCSDPMTGFFCVRRDAVDTSRLRPRGFKILVEILARHEVRVSEVPFPFGPRTAGVSKASWQNGIQFLRQVAELRVGRMIRFAAVGALGTLVNLASMWLLLSLTGLHYVAAAVAATELAIVHNFLLQERYVFADLRAGQHGYRARLLRSVAFNNLETLARIPLLVALVSGMHFLPVLAQALTLGVACVARFAWTSRVVYRCRAEDPPGHRGSPAGAGGGPVVA